MAFTDNEEARVAMIEEVLNELQIAFTKCLTKQQMTQLLVIKQSQIDALSQRVTALESQIAILNAKI